MAVGRKLAPIPPGSSITVVAAVFSKFQRIVSKFPRPAFHGRAWSLGQAKYFNLTRGTGMKRYFSLGLAALLGLSLLAGTPSFGKGGGHGHSGGHAHSGGHPRSAAHPHSGGHAHSSGHPSGHHSPAHAAPSHSTPSQLTHNSQPHPHPTHNHAAPPHVAGQSSSSSRTFSHSGGHWHHHHDGWSWSDGGGAPGNYGSYWNSTPGVVVVPEETELIEQQYVTRVTTPPVRSVPSLNSPTPSLTPTETDPDQAPKAP